ncbi:MAG: hypothetical protein V3W41_06920 [Planctomycetota bacterium]
MSGDEKAQSADSHRSAADSNRSAAAIANLRTLLEDLDWSGLEDTESRERLIEEAAALGYYLSRKENPDLPPLDLIFGPSGAGKSSLFNLLSGGDHAHTSSVERPASRGALLGSSAEILEEIESLDLFPTFEIGRVKGQHAQKGEEGRVGLLAMSQAPSGGGVLIDCPDYDTRVDANRRIAERLIRWADRIVFVTSLERYADRSAQPYLSEIAERQVPVFYLLNKAEGDAAQLAKDCLSQLMQLGGPKAKVGIMPRAEPAALGQAEVLEEIRAFLASSPNDDRHQASLGRFVADCRKSISAPLIAWAERRAALLRRLDEVLAQKTEFDHGPNLSPFERFEDDTKFWLRYSPRSMWRGAKDLIRRPKSLFEAPKIPREPDRNEIATLVVDQAWSAFDELQIRTRETMKADALGRQVVADEQFAASDFDRDHLRRHFGPLIDRLTQFSQKTLERFRSEHDARRGSWVAQFRFWAVDKVLKLLFLSVHFTVIPIVVYTLLEKIGMESFSNEVKNEFREDQELYRELLHQGLKEQFDAYVQRVDALGPNPKLAVHLELLLQSIEEELT